MSRIHTHPGEILLEEFLKPLGISARALAADIGVPANRISDLIRQRRGMTADTAMRLARYFNTTPQLWLNLQSNHDLSEVAAGTDYSSIRQHVA